MRRNRTVSILIHTSLLHSVLGRGDEGRTFFEENLKDVLGELEMVGVSRQACENDVMRLLDRVGRESRD